MMNKAAKKGTNPEIIDTARITYNENTSNSIKPFVKLKFFIKMKKTTKPIVKS